MNFQCAFLQGASHPGQKSVVLVRRLNNASAVRAPKPPVRSRSWVQAARTTALPDATATKASSGTPGNFVLEETSVHENAQVRKETQELPLTNKEVERTDYHAHSLLISRSSCS